MVRVLSTNYEMKVKNFERKYQMNEQEEYKNFLVEEYLKCISFSYMATTIPNMTKEKLINNFKRMMEIEEKLLKIGLTDKEIKYLYDLCVKRFEEGQ